MLKKILLLIISIFTLILIGCDKPVDNPKDDPINEGDEVDLTEYQEFYKKNSDKFALDSGNYYLASHGYRGNSIQGFNNWYYYSYDNNEFKELSFNEEKGFFGNDEAYINGIEQKASANLQVSKSFKVPSAISGNVKISFQLTSGSNGELVIFQNNNVVYPQGSSLSIDKSLEYGHYYEFDLSVKENDMIHFVTKSGVTNLNPSIMTLDYEETSIHQGDDEAYIGDVHPFYYDGRMYMYYLDTDGKFSTKLMTSTDLIRYSKETLNRIQPYPATSTYYALGIAQKDDTFYSYFGYSADYIYSSESKDLYNWQAHQETSTTTVDLKAGGRDPFVFYDPDVNKYRIIYVTYDSKNKGTDWDCALYLKTSKEDNLDEFIKEGKELIRFDNSGPNKTDDPEVSQMFKIGDYWYISASIYSRTLYGVGEFTYWIGDKGKGIDEIDWNSKQENNLDSYSLCAAQLVQINNKYYLFGWISQSSIGGGWGGSINIAREVCQNPDGTLYTRLDPMMSIILNQGLITNLSEIAESKYTTTGNVTVTKEEITFGKGEKKYDINDFSSVILADKFSRVIVKSTIDLSKGKTAGFYVNSQDSKGKHFILFDKDKMKVTLYSRSVSGTVVKAEQSLVGLDLSNIMVDIYIDDTIMEVFINNKLSLCSRMVNINIYELVDMDIAIFGSENSTIKDLDIYKMASAEHLIYLDD